MEIEETTRRGKYYETELTITLDNGRVVWITLNSDDPEPSYAELDNWGGPGIAAREEFDRECSDGHYEREATRTVADGIIDWARDP